jgi:hypothetical protein
LDEEVRSWERRQDPMFSTHSERQRDRHYNSVLSDRIPPNTCVAFKDALAAFDTSSYCSVSRRVSAFVFRDWWSLRQRCEFDIDQLCRRIKRGRIIDPASYSATLPTGTASASVSS